MEVYLAIEMDLYFSLFQYVHGILMKKCWKHDIHTHI